MTAHDISSDPRWGGMLAAPYKSINAAIDSLIAECFACFRKRGSASDGAWFDCDQLQIEHPHCYDNPVTVTETPVYTSEVSRNVVTSQELLLREPFANETHLEVLTVLPSDNLASIILKTKSAAKDLNSPKSKTPKFPQRKQRVARNTFTTIVEQDRCYSYRNEPRTRSQQSHHKPSIRSPILQRKSIPPISIDFDDSFPFGELDSDSEDDFKSLTPVGDVWKPFELEQVFDFYNDFALQLFPNPALSPLSGRRQTRDKFDEVFPSFSKSTGNRDSANNNDIINNNSIKEFTNKNINSLSFISSASSKLKPERVTKQISIEKQLRDRDKELNISEIKDLIELCIYKDDYHEILSKKDDERNLIFFSSTLLKFFGRNFSKKLLFDLVKQTMDEYLVEYKSSLSIGNENHIYYVQRKVLSILQSHHYDLYLSTQWLISDDILSVRKRLKRRCSFNYDNKEPLEPQEKVIANIASEEIKYEHQSWQDFQEEEQLTKSTVAFEVFNILLENELKLIEIIFRKKQKLVFNECQI